VPFEVAIGSNGRVWVNSTSALHTVLVSNAIINSEHLAPSAVQAMVDALLAAVK
jgi:exosome complex RNA-binding protein Rrp4